MAQGKDFQEEVSTCARADRSPATVQMAARIACRIASGCAHVNDFCPDAILAKDSLIERFTRTGPDTVDYRFTVEDPTTFTRAWTASIPMTTLSERIYEYACHKGNYGIYNILAGHRAEEKASQEANRK